MRRLLVPLVLAASLMAPQASFAQDADKQAETLFAEGIAAKDRGDDETACKKFTESFDLSGKIGPLLNLAECEEKRGHPATALARWKRGLVLLQEKGSDKRIGTVQDRIKALEKVVPRLTVKLAPDAPEGTRVRIDGVQIEMPSGPVPVDPGDRTVSVTAPDREESKTTVTVVELDRKEVTVAPGPPVSAVKSGGGGSDGGSGGSSGSGGSGSGAGGAGPGDGGDGVNKAQRLSGFVILGVGVAGLAAGGITGGLMVQKHNQLANNGCDEDSKQCSTQAGYKIAQDGAKLGLVNTISLAAGAGCAVLGTVLLLTSGGKAKPPETTGVITPLPGGAGVFLRTSF